MQYETRILDDAGKTELILAEIQIADQAAIESAQRIAHGHDFAVWRGMECVFDSRHAGGSPS